MRIRKILPLALLAIGTLFMLTGCDKLLDFIFSSNTIAVTVQAYAPKYYGFGTGGAITVGVSGSDGSYYTSTESSTDVDSYNYVNYHFSFPRLANATYTLQASYGGGLYTGGSYYTSFFWDPAGNYTTSITLPYSGGGSTTSVGLLVVMP